MGKGSKNGSGLEVHSAIRQGYMMVIRPGVRVLDPKGKELITVGDAIYEVSEIGVLTVRAHHYTAGQRDGMIPLYCAAPGQWGRVEIVELTPMAAPKPKTEAPAS